MEKKPEMPKSPLLLLIYQKVFKQSDFYLRRQKATISAIINKEMLCVYKRLDWVQHSVTFYCHHFFPNESLSNTQEVLNKKKTIKQKTSPHCWWKCQHFYATFRKLQQEYANTHFSSLTLKYTRPLCQLWMSFVFPKSGAPVEMFTFSLLLILVNLNKGNVNRDTLRYHCPKEHRGKENKTFPLLRVLSAQSSCRSPQYSAPRCLSSVVFKAWRKYEKLNINIS